MVEVRFGFGLTAVADGLIATGGFKSGWGLSSVEVFSFTNGWNFEPRLDMSSTKYNHCSIIMESWLYTIGGMVGGSSGTGISNLVEAIDTADQSAAWIRKASMLEKRTVHSCHVGVFEGQEGIYVAGGNGVSGYYVSSAEFYNPVLDIWQEIASLTTGRGWSSMTMLGGDLIVSGGSNDQDYLSSVEMWNGSNWVELNDQRLEVERSYHAAVSIKAGVLSCV